MTDTVEPTDRPRRGKSPGPLRQPRVRVGAILAIALLIGFVVWLIVRGGSSSPTSPGPRAGAVPVSVRGLKTLAAAVPTPIYWAGTKSGVTMELTKTSDNRVFIRYLPLGAQIGTDKPYLTVGTYPVRNAYAVVRNLARRSGAVKVSSSNGAVAFYNDKAPTNVYLAYPGSDYEVEVYDPSASLAQQLVSSGQVTLVPGANGTARAAHAVSPAGLKALASSLHHPVYWAGAQPGVTYEVTQTAGGRIFIRYLPSGTRVGVNKPYLTIGTYPIQNAFSVTQSLSRRAGAAVVNVGGGAVAFYNQSRPTSIYVAYPGNDLQVEVYDPTPGRARALVTSRRIKPVG